MTYAISAYATTPYAELRSAKLLESGSPTWARTRDLRINSPSRNSEKSSHWLISRSAKPQKTHPGNPAAARGLSKLRSGISLRRLHELAGAVPDILPASHLRTARARSLLKR